MRFWLKMEILLSSFRTQSDFAKFIGKSDYWLSRVIRGRIDPSDDEKKLIATALKTDVTEKLFFKVEHVLRLEL
jgi:transcriptional regulator with XRE-family HTH domain